MAQVKAKNVLKVADAIERRAVPGLGFSMDYLKLSTDDVNPDFVRSKDKSGAPDCGTVACIAGWANAIKGHLDDATFERAAEFLGLDREQEEDLFYARNHPLAKTDRWGDTFGPLEDITAEQAVRTLRRLAETGVVDWTA